MLLDYRTLLAAIPRSHIESATPLGLVLGGDLTRDNWSELVSSLVQTGGQIGRGTHTLTAWLGDLLAYGSGKYRGQIAEYAKALGCHPGTLRDAKLVCSRIPVSCRHDKLSWSHHVEVGKAFISAPDIEHWLHLAATEQLSRNELRQRIRAHLKTTPLRRTPEDEVKVAPFTLLRELRAAGRIVQSQQAVWQEWSPQTCELALVEIDSLVKFIGQMSARTRREAATSAGS